MLKSISIEGLRGFGKKEKIDFSIPDNKRQGSGLNIIVGPNNSGKTTITEAIKYYNVDAYNISFSEGKRNEKTNSKINIKYYDSDGSTYEINTVDDGGSSVNIHTDGEILTSKIPYCLPSRRNTDYYMYNMSEMDRYSYSINQISNTRNRQPNLNSYDGRIFKWQKDRKKFDNVLKKILDKSVNWRIEQNDEGNYYIKIIFGNNDVVHTREGIGDGYWSIFTIIDALYDSKNDDLIVIDEPELSIHPALQRKLIKLLEEYSKDRQIIITTHSPFFISIDAIINGGMLIRTYKDKDLNIRIGSVDDTDRDYFKSIKKDIFNPHVMGIEGKEMFFLDDNIIITEGQEDVTFYPIICTKLGIKLNVNLFGWGSGGVGNITSLLRLLKNLGYKKLTAVYDGDQEDKFLEAKELFKDYNILILPADDIRDKLNYKNEIEKHGIIDKDKEIYEEYKEPFKKLIQDINKYHEEI